MSSGSSFDFYLGCVVGLGTHAPDPTKVETIKELLSSQRKSEVRSTLGLCGYYRECVPKFAQIARPLTMLTGKKIPTKIPSSSEADAAVQTFKDSL